MTETEYLATALQDLPWWLWTIAILFIALILLIPPLVSERIYYSIWRYSIGDHK